MEETDIAVNLKEKKQRLKEYQKKYRQAKSLNVIMKRIFFQL